MRKRNGKIELMRFVFTMYVLCFHINLGVWENKKGFTETISFFRHGNLGVEFFFLVSGFLMAATLNRYQEPPKDSTQLTNETLSFLWRKLKGILPYHLFFSAVMGLFMIVAGQYQNLIIGLPSLLFFNRTGFMAGKAILGVEWYIGSMLTAMIILYPLGRKGGSFFTRVVAPFAGIMIIGWMTKTQGLLSSAGRWDGLTFHCNLRAIAELCLGIACFEVCSAMQRHNFTKFQKFLLSAAEFLGYAFATFYICSFMPYCYECYVLIVLCISVTISFSQQGLLGKNKLFQHPIFSFLGGITLPIYLIQEIFQEGVLYFLPNLRHGYQALLMFVLAIAFGTISYLIWTSFTKRKANV